MLLKLLKANNYLSVYLIILIGINLFLQTLPLTNVFGYEFSALNSLFLSFLSGLYIISSLSSVSKEKQELYLRKFVSVLAWMLIIPIAISIAKSIVTGFCSFWDGLLFYLVITVPSVVIGSAIGSTIYAIFKKFRVLVFIFFYLIILFIPVLEIYFNPQVYLYNPLFAYFPGNIYDEGLSVDLKLILYRIFNLIFFSFSLYYFLNLGIKKTSVIKNFYFTLLAIFISVVFYFLISPLFGFTTKESSLKEKLSYYVESEHFIIQADTRIDKEVLQQIALNQEYYYSQHSIFFREELSTKIKSFIFFDSEQKKNLFGAGAADVAKPWLNSIYVSADTWESTLKHEIAHCFTADFGTGIFKLAAGFNPALIEGVAEAADGFYDENSIHFLASLAFQNDYRVDLSSMFSSFSFFGSVSSLSYIYSGSFIKYLTNEYGIEKVKHFYQSNDFEKSFDTDLNSSVKNYEIFLDTLFLNSTGDKANFYFGRKALISKVCPRYVSSSLAVAWEYYSRKDYDRSYDIYENILSKTESFSAVIGLAKILEDSDSLSEAISLLQSRLRTFLGTSSEYDLKFRLAELYVKNDELDKAEELYSFLFASKPNRKLELLSSTRISLINNGSIKNYVIGSEFDRYTILKELNLQSYDYSSIPLMIELSRSLKEDYHLFIKIFENNLYVKDEISSYAVLKLSEYMSQNFDYVRARKMAGFALRYRSNVDLLKLTEENSKKSEWFFKNAERILSETKFELN